VDFWPTVAATNNAEWCDRVCRSHGVETRWDDDAWTGDTRTPPLYPDAVTLVPEPAMAPLLARIDTSPGCSIKDSFASLDLRADGFRVLFDAHWIVRPAAVPPPPEASPPWEPVRDDDELASWEQAWRGDDGPTGIFGPALLAMASVTIVGARRGGRLVAGAVLCESPTVVGISNFFSDSAEGWSGCLRLATSLFPAATVVGYESGRALTAARRHGFVTVGPLRVWVLEG
jgi:hypothetical protein